MMNTQAPMVIKGQTLRTANVHNIHSCGPNRVQSAIEQCLRHLPKSMAHHKEIIAYDPLCGNGVVPSEFRANFSGAVRGILASDVNDLAVKVTRENLQQFDRPDAAPFEVFRHNILRPFPASIEDGSVNMVITDPPYGAGCQWVGEHGQRENGEHAQQRFLDALFNNLTDKMAEHSVIGVITHSRMHIADRIGQFEKREEFSLRLHSILEGRMMYIMKPVGSQSPS